MSPNPHPGVFRKVVDFLAFENDTNKQTTKKQAQAGLASMPLKQN